MVHGRRVFPHLVDEELTMSPYRSSSSSPTLVARRRHPAARRKTFGIILFACGATAAGPAVAISTLAVACAGVVAFLGLALAITGRSRTPLTRLCALAWHRGDRLGATMLLFGVIQPRYSARRIAKNRAAVVAVSSRCITYRNKWLFPDQR